MTATSSDQDHFKLCAAIRAVDDVKDGMVVGLGTGTTVRFVIETLAERVAQGLHVECIPTSQHTAELASGLGIPLTSFAQHQTIDLTIDGADEVERGTLNLIKGAGGALLREKIVAASSKRVLIVIDQSKLVDMLGTKMPIPVEISPFGCETTIARLRDAHLSPKLRTSNGAPYVTDGGNYIAECAFGFIADAITLDTTMRSIVGVFETGIFIGLASNIIIGCANGVTIL